MVYSAKSDSTTISQFTRRKKITITTNGTSTPINYQCKLTITYESEMQADFEDIRFNTIVGGYIDYWIESYTASTSAVVWVELSDVITDPGSDIIYMYYGNSGLSDGGVGADTFVQYHGSASDTFKDSNIVGASNIIYEGSCKGGTTTIYIQMGQCEGSIPVSPNDDVYLYMHNSLGKYGSIRNGTTTSNTDWQLPKPTVNVYHRYKIINTSLSSSFYVDNVKFGATLTTGFPDENMGLFGYSVLDGFYQEWSFLRKYIANEPTPSYGTAQHQRRIPQFIG